MLKKESIEISTKVSPERLHSKSTIKLYVPDDVLNQIKYLCRNISEVEWSGIVFYEIEGSIRNPDDMSIILKDILPLDKGSSSFTEYELDERYVEYRMSTPSRMDYRMGHIHSHNNMAVYFSGVDMGELDENAPGHNFYLSFIVNNRLDFCAKVACSSKTAKTIHSVQELMDENGDMYKVSGTEKKVKTQLITYDCIIESNSSTIVEQEFKDKVKGIIEDRKNKDLRAPENYWANPNWSVKIKEQLTAPISRGEEFLLQSICEIEGSTTGQEEVGIEICEIDNLVEEIELNGADTLVNLFNDLSEGEYYLIVVEAITKVEGSDIPIEHKNVLVGALKDLCKSFVNLYADQYEQ